MPFSAANTFRFLQACLLQVGQKITCSPCEWPVANDRLKRTLLSIARLSTTRSLAAPIIAFVLIWAPLTDASAQSITSVSFSCGGVDTEDLSAGDVVTVTHSVNQNGTFASALVRTGPNLLYSTVQFQSYIANIPVTRSYTLNATPAPGSLRFAVQFYGTNRTVVCPDETAPVISGIPADITQNTDAGLNTAVVSWSAPTATDNVGVTSFTSTHSPGDVFPVGTTTVSYTAVDDAGNTTVASFDVTVGDAEVPVISGIPADITQNTDAGLNTAVVSWSAPTATDNVGVTSFTSTHSPGDVFPVGTTTVSYTAVDDAGNTTVASFDVTVGDAEVPVISGIPADITQNTDAGLNTAVVSWSAPTATDNVGVTSFTSTHSPGDVFPVGTTTVSYTAVDDAGNTTVASFDVTVGDAEVPVISGIPADITQNTDAGLNTAVVSWSAPTATDNVGVTSFTSTHSPGDVFPVGTTTVSYTAVDDAGNTTVASFDVTVGDAEVPVISGIPADITQNTDAGLNTAVVSWSAPTATDNVGVTSFTSTHSPGDVFPVGTTTVSYTAVDDAGNTTVASFDVTVGDAEVPVISGIPADITQNTDAGLNTAVVSWSAPTATDNVGVTSFTSTHSPGDVFPVGTTTVSYTAVDDAGNTTVASFDVTVGDAEVPVISGIPADITQNTDAGLNTAVVSWSAPTATDNVGVTSFTSTHSPGDVFPVGTTTVSYTAVDDAGNTTVASFDVTVGDAEVPVISGIPADITQNTDAGLNTAVVSWSAPTATDNVGVTSFTSTHSPGDVFPVGTTTVSYTAVDDAGNTTVASFDVTVGDAEVPVISGIPADITQNTDAGLNTAVVSWSAPTATDNVGVTSFTSTHSPGDVFPVGTTTVSYTAVDDAGNTTVASFDVTVGDAEVPVISGIPADITQNTDAGLNTAVVSWSAPTATDNVGVTSFTSTHSPGDVFPVGTTTVSYTAVDDAGNTTVASFDVTVGDAEVPVISGIPADITQNTDAGLNTAVVSWSAPTATDNVGVTSFTSTHSPGDVFPVGTTTVSYTAVDDAGNTTVASFDVTVGDAEVPVISGIPADITQNTDAGLNTAVVSWSAPTATDNVGVTSFTSTHSPGDVFPVGTTTVSYTAVDDAGNTTVASFDVTVFEAIPPTVSISGAQTEFGSLEPITITITYSEPVTGFESTDISVTGGAVTVLAGGPTTYTAEILPSGTGDVSAQVNAGVASDAAGNLNLASNVFNIRSQIVSDTRKAIAGFMLNRASSLAKNQPDITHFLRGYRGSNCNRLSSTATPDSASIDTCISSGDTWASVAGAWSNDESYVLATFGTHTFVSDEFLVGLMFQLDHAETKTIDAVVEGTGWLAGPYFVAKHPVQSLFFEGRLLYGETSNEIHRFDMPSDSFETQRLLANLRVTGEIEQPMATFLPHLDFTYTTDRQKGYIDGFGNYIAPQSIDLTQLTMGIDWLAPIEVSSGTLVLTGGVSGIWSDVRGNTEEFGILANETFSARAEIGFEREFRKGTTLTASAFYDGIGSSASPTYGVSVGLKMSF